MRIWATAFTLLIVTMAGCADDPAPATGEDDPFQEIPVDDDEGIIRGIVLDPTITPIQGATITLQGPGTTAKSDADGLFFFTELEPGTYFLETTKLGFSPVQSSVSVVAGVERPEILKVQIVPDPTTAPRVAYHQYEGTLQCSFNLVAVGFAACGLLEGTGLESGESQVRYDIDGEPAWIQTEMVWDSSQPLGDSLSLMYSYGDCDTFYCDHDVEGMSPLVLSANATLSEDILSQEERQLYIRVFGTETSAAAGTGVGATLEQRFTHYTSVFYGFQPDEGWTLIEDGAHPLPL